MFASISNLGPVRPPSNQEDKGPREIPPPTPVNLPNCIPLTDLSGHSAEGSRPLASLLRGIQRPADVKIEHLQILGLHVIPDAPIEDIIPDPSYLPPKSWLSLSPDEIEDVKALTQRRLGDGRDSPGAKTYLERIRELSTPNDAAYRTVRRLGSPLGEPNARLGNAYEFFRNLELVAGFWVDTSVPPTDLEAMDVTDSSNAWQEHQRIGTGSQTPPEFRNSLLAAFAKLVAYDFGCNVTVPRIEPRLYISTSGPSSTTSSFPTNISFVYHTPTARTSARAGIVEGPVVALSSRHSTSFKSLSDSIFDLCREVAALLVTAQQRARESRTEKKPLEDLWWCHKPRWGGGTGGPIGREADKVDETSSEADARRSAGPSPLKKSRKKISLYDNYRMVRPPSSTWDRKTKYMSIGKQAGADFDDIFLLSCLFHHVSIVRARLPTRLMDELEGHEGALQREDSSILWRSRWYDMFIVADRVEAMTCIWGMMAYMMRSTEAEVEVERD